MSKGRISSAFFPEASQAFFGKISTISDLRVSTHFSQLSRAADDTSFFGPDVDKRYSYCQKPVGSTGKLIDATCKRDTLPMFGHWGGRKFKKTLQTFCTGSRYLGEWNALGFSGEGVYRFSHGVIYEGEFNSSGMFHGIGTLTYPNGQKIQGVWRNGELTDNSTFIFACGEVLDEDFKYCQKPDRRFHTEIQKEFGPPGQEYLTNDQPTKRLPKGCYDVVEGLFDPQSGCIMSYPKNTHENSQVKKNKPVSLNLDDDKEKHLKEIASRSIITSESMIMTSLVYDEDPYGVEGQRFIEIPTASKVTWIKENCRRAWDENTGYRPEFYEQWMAGRRYEVFSQEDVEDSDAEPKWLRDGEKGRSEDDQSAKFVRFVQRKLSISDRALDKFEKAKNSRTSPTKHDAKQRWYGRERNFGNSQIV